MGINLIRLVAMAICLACVTQAFAERGIGMNVKQPSTSYKKPSFIKGNYHALVIGNNKYRDPKREWQELGTAVADAKSVAQLLKKSYGFDNVIELYDADRRKTLKGFNQLTMQVGKHDSVLIFYAGHGHLNDRTDEAYWVPVDAEGEDDSTFIRNSTIKDKVAVIAAKAHHVLLVSDSCFSGTLLRGGNRGRKKKDMDEPWFHKVSAKKSVQVLAAGGVEFVDDNYKRSGHSPFTYYFLSQLRENTDPYYTATDLSSQVERSVANNVKQRPHKGILYGAGHDNGEFIFLRTDIQVAMAGATQPVKPIAPPSSAYKDRSATVSKEVELEVYRAAKASGDPALLMAYLRQYPNGVFSDFVRRDLRQGKEAEKETQKSDSVSREQEISRLFQLADTDYRSKRYVEPEGNNAKHHLEAIIRLDPGNKKAGKALNKLAHKLVKLAVKEIDNQEFVKAGWYLDEAQKINPNLDGINMVRKRLNSQSTESDNKPPQRKEVQRIVPPPSF